MENEKKPYVLVAMEKWSPGTPEPDIRTFLKIRTLHGTFSGQ